MHQYYDSAKPCHVCVNLSSVSSAYDVATSTPCTKGIIDHQETQYPIEIYIGLERWFSLLWLDSQPKIWDTYIVSSGSVSEHLWISQMTYLNKSNN